MMMKIIIFIVVVYILIPCVHNHLIYHINKLLFHYIVVHVYPVPYLGGLLRGPPIPITNGSSII